MTTPISSFAYNTAREIERMVESRVGNILGRCEHLEGKILEFFSLLKKKSEEENTEPINIGAVSWMEEYSKHFDIKEK